MGDYNAADEKTDAAECVDKSERILVVGDAEVAAALVAFNIVGGNGDNDLRLVLHFKQHLDLAVRLEARQYARCVVIVKQLAAEFEVQLAAEFCDSVSYVARLLAHVFFVVEADHIHNLCPSIL